MSTAPVVLDYERVTLRDRTDKFKHNLPSHVRHYICSFFPIFQWITRYNTAWMTQDAIAGMTVGMMFVPQGIAYAKIANLDPQYGLYASFAGSCLYCVFGTSKDISIGPITVVSMLVGHAITNVTTAHPDISGPEVGAYLCVITGLITILLGMVRLGILVDFIPGPAIAGYMTGSAITISLGQWGKLVGMKLNTHQAPYLVVGDFLSNLSGIGIDVAFGVPSLIALYVIKISCSKLGARYPKYKQPLFYLGIMRSAVVLIIGTFISFLANMNKSESPFKILKDVPAGFDAIGVPRMNMNIFGEIMDVLPSIIIIMVLEHVSVAKSFGRISDYVIDPNQEILAIGVTNLAGAFFGGYPGTGAFSRTAIMSRSGAKTPLSSAFSAIVIVLALYILTPAFYYIPSALLAAVVIHAVTDLVSGPKYVKELLNTSKLEFLVFASAVLITFFDGVENGIYVALALSLFIVMINLARPKIAVLTRSPLESTCNNDPKMNSVTTPVFGGSQHYVYVDEKDPHFQKHTEPMPPGIVVLRLSSALLYPNAGHVNETIVSTAKARTRKAMVLSADGSEVSAAQQDKNLMWNQPRDTADRSYLPVLEAVVLDCTAVNRIDTTGLQALCNARELLDRYAGHAVEWHFTGLVSKQVRNDLILYGFGSLANDDLTLYDSSSVSRSTTLKNDDEEAAIAIDSEKIQQVMSTTGDADNEPTIMRYNKQHDQDEESKGGDHVDMADIVHPYYMEDDHKFSQVIVDPHQNLPRDRMPCFHWDIDSAVRSICDRWSSRPRTPMMQNVTTTP